MPSNLLGANPDEKLFAVCETPKCLPDAPQVIAHITTGNGRLRVLPIGRFAITVNRASDKPTADAVRVCVDLEKIKQFPVIDQWFSNSPSFDKHTMGIALQEEIFRNGRKLLSYRAREGAGQVQGVLEAGDLPVVRRDCAGLHGRRRQVRGLRANEIL